LALSSGMVMPRMLFCWHCFRDPISMIYEPFAVMFEDVDFNRHGWNLAACKHLFQAAKLCGVMLQSLHALD